MEVIWRFHWDALGCHSWAPNKLHCWISTAHMEALCERKSFPAPAENLASQFCFQSHSYSFCFSVSFLMFFFSGWVCVGHHFLWLSLEAWFWLHGPIIWSLVSGRWQTIQWKRTRNLSCLCLSVCPKDFDTSWLSPVIYLVCALLWIKIT